MNIDKNSGLDISSLNSVYEMKQSVKSVKDKTTITSLDAGDTYRFNVSAKELQHFFDLASKSDGIRYDKLQQLNEDIQKGTYQVSGRDIVNKLLEEK